MIDTPAQGNIKICKMCCKEIPAQAKKCPYCHHWQNTLSMIVFHPAFAIVPALVVTVVLVAIVGLTLSQFGLLGQGERFQDYEGQIAVSESTLMFGERGGGPSVAVVGRMKNSSLVDWKEVYFQVDFINPQGELFDAGQEYDYSYCLPAGKETSFKISFPREFPESEYSSHTIRVIWAKDARRTL